MKVNLDAPFPTDKPLGFGKFKRLTLAQILVREPSYILWLDREKVLVVPPDVLKAAKEEEQEIREEESDRSNEIARDDVLEVDTFMNRMNGRR